MMRYADFSPCRTWRYSLRRLGLAHSGRNLLAVMLNPSKADEERDDPTTTFMMRLAQREDCGAYEAVNCFALVDTYPGGLYKHPAPVGEWGRNDEAIHAAAKRADLVVIAWGNHGQFLDRADRVLELLSEWDHELMCFGHNANGTPRFPRAIRSDVELISYQLPDK